MVRFTCPRGEPSGGGACIPMLFMKPWFMCPCRGPMLCQTRNRGGERRERVHGTLALSLFSRYSVIEEREPTSKIV